MALNYQSASTAVLTTHANGVGTSPTVLPATLTPVPNGPSPPHACIEHIVGVASHDCSTPPPPPHPVEPSFDLDGDAFPPYVHDSPLFHISHVPIPNKVDNGTWLVDGPLEDPLSIQSTRDAQSKLTHIPALEPSRCSTTWTLGSRQLNYHVNPDNNIYRWQMTEKPIPVGIDLSSFDSVKEGRMVEECLIAVLNKFNASNVGPKFCHVVMPFHSAFFVRYGGDYPLYALSFFPGSPPKDWYIDVYKLSLTLSDDQEQFLMDTRRGDLTKARKEALERNLISILTHEMLHVVGVRHCDAQLRERETCVRFPPTLSDDENNEELLMQPSLDWRNLHRLKWLSRTVQEIQQIYAMRAGERIGCHSIRDVSWKVGAKQRKEIALRNARCCVA